MSTHKCGSALQERTGRGSLGEGLRDDFPILHQEVNNKPLIYLDNAATSQKPTAVVESITDYYNRYNSNVHRGVHHLSGLATAGYEAARAKLAVFIKAASYKEIVFTKNASEALNLVAHSWGLANLKPGDEVLLSVAEHHSNLIPWQLVAQRTGAVLRHVPLTKDTQELDMKAFHELLSPKTKLVGLVLISNVLGCVAPVQTISEAAHKVGAKVLFDASQAVPHMAIDVQATGADFIVGTAHKLCGPTGIGFLWGREEVLESMPPFMGGGEMIENVGLTESTYAPPPSRFEPGTPGIAEGIGFGSAIDYLSAIGMDKVYSFEQEIGGLLYQELEAVEGVTIYGPRPERGRAALCSFNVEGIHPTDISTILDMNGVAVRSGHLCTQPLHAALGISASVRASLYIYNTPAEVEVFISELKDAIKFFS